MNLERLPIGEDVPGLVNVVVEVPVGNRNKYELGVFLRDRVLPGNICSPTDCGFVLSTEGADGEPLDTLVAAYDPVFPGCVIRARVIGALEVIKGGNTEYDIFVVPDDPCFEDIATLGELPEPYRCEVEQFYVTFRHPEGDEEAEVRGRCGLEEAREIIRKPTR